MSMNIGSFGARLTRDQTVADGVWTKVVFNEVVSYLSRKNEEVVAQWILAPSSLASSA
jgi:hypothetical protein